MNTSYSPGARLLVSINRVSRDAIRSSLAYPNKEFRIGVRLGMSASFDGWLGGLKTTIMAEIGETSRIEKERRRLSQLGAVLEDAH